jgi:hypothetical protein
VSHRCLQQQQHLQLQLTLHTFCLTQAVAATATAPAPHAAHLQHGMTQAVAATHACLCCKPQMYVCWLQQLCYHLAAGRQAGSVGLLSWFKPNLKAENYYGQGLKKKRGRTKHPKI